MLSGDELLTLAEADTRQKESHLRDRVFGLLDCSAAIFFFLPLFGQTTDGVLQEVSLLSLTEIATYLRTAYFAALAGMVAAGIAMLALQTWQQAFWLRHKYHLSLVLHIIGALLFIIGSQPYAAALLFLFFAIKVFLRTKL